MVVVAAAVAAAVAWHGRVARAPVGRPVRESGILGAWDKVHM